MTPGSGPSLSVAISADTRALMDGLNRVSGAVEQLTATTQKGADRAGQSLEKMGVTASSTAGLIKGLAGAFASQQFAAAIGAGIKDIANLGETAKRTGMDLQRLQELRLGGQMQGLSGAAFDKGLEGLSEKLNESRQQETALSKLFADNNLKLKTRTGEIISTNEALEKVAGLVQNAATEFDKIKIAEAVGLTRDWVPLLEQGAEGLAQAARNGRETGGVIDAEIVARAKEFDERWQAAVVNWTTMFKANLSGVIDLINAAIGLASKLGSAISGYATRINANADIDRNGVAGMSRETANYALDQLKRAGQPVPPNVRARIDQLDEMDREAARARGFPRFVAPPVARDQSSATNTSSLFSGGRGRGGGGGGSEVSEADKAEQRLNRYTDSLRRQGDVLEAEIATFGRSTSERKAAIEIAKAQVDLQRLDSDSRERVITAIKGAVAANEQHRQTLERMAGIQIAARDLASDFAGAVADLADKSKGATDALASLARSIGRDLINSALAGTGSFAQAFGTKDSGGVFGSLFTSLLSGLPKFATGGTLPAGLSMVGERGPEIVFSPQGGQRVVSNSDSERMLAGALSSRGGVSISIDARGSTTDSVMALKRELPAIILKTLGEQRRRS